MVNAVDWPFLAVVQKQLQRERAAAPAALPPMRSKKSAPAARRAGLPEAVDGRMRPIRQGRHVRNRLPGGFPGAPDARSGRRKYVTIRPGAGAQPAGKDATT